MMFSTLALLRINVFVILQMYLLLNEKFKEV